jgi:hypothetical protein
MTETGPGSHDELRALLGAYVLGGLASPDRTRVESHIRACPACRDELAELTPVRFVLDRTRRWIDDDSAVSESVPDDLALRRLLARAKAEDRKGSTPSRVRGAAAAVVIALVLAGGFFGSRLVDDDEAPAALTAVLQTESHASGQVLVEERTWGAAIHLDAAGLTYGGNLTLEVEATDGRKEIAATWGPTPNGRCKVDGATSIPPSAISSVHVVGPDGHDLLWATLS